MLERLAGSEAADALRAPYRLGDPSELPALFARAQWSNVSIETRSGTARFPSVRSMAEADLRGWVPVMGIDLDVDLIEQIPVPAEAVLASFVTTDGSMVLEAPAHIVTAVL